MTVLADEEAQDSTLVLEMAQRMLHDILAGQMQPLRKYVLLFCDVLDDAEDARGSLLRSSVGRRSCAHGLPAS